MASTVAEVEARLRAGEDVSPDELLRAEVTERLARMKAEQAARAADERAEAERLARIAAFRASLPSRFDPAPLERARAKLAAAVDAFVCACRAYDDAQEAAVEELRGLGPLPDGLAVDAPRYGWITDGGREHGPSRPQVALAGIATEALRRHFPRRQIRLDNPQD